MNSFNDFGLAEPITRALAQEQYTTPTPIQADAIPIVMTGRDLVGIAQTGTGKTAAFALPILNRLANNRKPLEKKSPRVLVLSPTRELSGQILESFRTYGRHMRIQSALVIGGVPMGRQVRDLMGGLDVLVATPGRLLDLMKQNGVRLNQVEVLVLDEADRMLDMGFIHDIRTIISKLPKERQTLLFSATMPREIADLAAHMLRDPARVAVTPVASTVERIVQRVIMIDKPAKSALLIEVLRGEVNGQSLVFTRTKHGADKVVKSLHHAGGHRRARTPDAEGPGQGLGRRRPPRWSVSRSGSFTSTAAASRRCCPTSSSRNRMSTACWCSPAPSMAPTRWSAA